MIFVHGSFFTFFIFCILVVFASNFVILWQPMSTSCLCMIAVYELCIESSTAMCFILEFVF